jgi:hypothetical protein
VFILCVSGNNVVSVYIAISGNIFVSVCIAISGNNVVSVYVAISGNIFVSVCIAISGNNVVGDTNTDKNMAI